MIDGNKMLEFLKSETNGSYTFKDNDKQYAHEKTYSTIKINEDFSIVIDFRKSNFNNFKNLGWGYQNSFEVEAIFLPKINTLIVENAYDNINVDNDSNLKIYVKEHIFDQIYNEIAAGLLNIQDSLKNAYKHERELIDQYKVDNKDYAMRVLIGKDEHKSYYLYHEAYKKNQNHEMIYEYLQYPAHYINEFVVNYIKDENYAENLKELITREIAIQELLVELENDEYIIKAKKVYQLLQNELKAAKKIWVITNDNEEIQVETNIYPVSFKEFGLGRYDQRVYLPEMKQFKYGRTYYDI